MIISYNWLKDYLGVGKNKLHEKIKPAKLGEILTSIGLEVESIESTHNIPGGLNGLITGEIISCEKHPNADKLNITTVSTGEEKILKIVCGASNVVVGQKVVVAPIGITIYPTTGEPVKIKNATIRGIESEGMICAEDEIGLGTNHNGILVLPGETAVGISVAELFSNAEDHIFEIGLTPNRMDAMSHIGVAKDICAWSTHHEANEALSLRLPYPDSFQGDNQDHPLEVEIKNPEACRRYSGISINNITVEDSPKWLQQKLKSIHVKPINNIVDITNFILHESGQPLHAFDAEKISGNKIIVQNAEEGKVFKTLDEKERKLFSTDLMICNEEAPMCIAGIYGGAESGVTKQTRNIFLESAWFNPVNIRKTSLRHNLRTDAAIRFEKGCDISNTINVLRRAALLIKETAGGEMAGEVDVFPEIPEKTVVDLNYAYIKKLSGKDYSKADISNILKSLGFEVSSQNADEIRVKVPYNKPDISLPADLVEEIMRIDGLDNIGINSAITILPSAQKDLINYNFKEKLAGYLNGLGFYEIFTNSITNSKFYNEAVLASSVKMINSLSADLDILRPRMIQGGLQAIAHNINRKNENLRFFDFGKTYSRSAEEKYTETTHLALYVTGNMNRPHWKIKTEKTDFYYLKGVVDAMLKTSGIREISYETIQINELQNAASVKAGEITLGYFGEVKADLLKEFDIKHTIFYADITWDKLLSVKNTLIEYHEISKFPGMTRDLALVVDKNVSYNQVQQIALAARIVSLKSVELFDVFVNDKLGESKKSMAVSFLFMNESKTLTDKEIDIYMQKIMNDYESLLNAEIRK